MSRALFSASLLVAGSLSLAASAQEPVSCASLEPLLSVHRANIFSPEQEKWLGDAQAELIEPQYMLLPTSRNPYLAHLGAKIAAQLPPATYAYTFHVFESGEVRSFSLAGGQIYLSRKLILDARNEDELAGVMAHEIARVYTHHTASTITLEMDKLMGIKSVGDRADVDDKFQRMLNIPKVFLQNMWKSHLSEQDRQDDELLADRVGFYAYLKAGYAPEAYASLLNRTTVEEEEFSSNAITNALNLASIPAMRVRLIKSLTKDLPADCRSISPKSSTPFAQFQTEMNRARVNPLTAPTPGLTATALDPPMSPALENVRISPDQLYVLAQDEWQIHVLSRNPLKLLFSIDALGAQMAQFTPDSANVVFYYAGLRFENWSIASQKPVSVLDFADYYGCLQASLSPDGFTFACFSRNWDMGWVKLSDLRTGKLLYENANFYRPQLQAQALDPALRSITEPRQASVAWSQDGRYFVASSGTASLAYDLKEMKTVSLGEELGHLVESRMAFVDADKLAFECDWGYKAGGPLDTFKMCFTSFPGGLPINSFTMGRTWLSSLTRSLLVLTGPAGKDAAALFDPATGKSDASFKLETLDLAGDVIAKEAETGGIQTGSVGGPMETAQLPITPLASLEAGFISTDGRFLALSDRARGAVWDLDAGKQVSLTGPFRSAAFDSDDKLEAQVQDHELKPARDIRVDRRTGKVAPTLSPETEEIRYGSVLVDFKPFLAQQTVSREVTIEARDAVSGTALWARRFKWSAPLLLQPDNDRQLLLVMDRVNQTGADEVDHNRKLVVRTSDQIKEFEERGLVVEVLDARTGEPQRIFVTPELPSRGRDHRSANLYGDLLTIYGDSNNTVVYSATTGKRLLAFFGRTLTADSTLGLVAATNRPQEVTIYDVATGQKVRSVMLDNYPLMARFVPLKHQLLVVSATQHVYRLDLPRAGASTLQASSTSPANAPSVMK